MELGERHAIEQVLRDDTSDANGDDAAVVHVPGARVVVTTDTAVEGIHLHASLTPAQMGYRAAACALSDLAGMAAEARAVTCAVQVPTGRWEDAACIVSGVRRRAQEHGADLVGGDLTAAAGDAWAINVTCIGVPMSAGPLRLDGARVGDLVVVTGTLGRSAAALRALAAPTRAAAPPADWYLAPPNRVHAARLLSPHATALTDVSDGAATEALRIATAAGLRVELDLDELPAEPALQAALLADEQLEIVAATAGDDYELMATVPPASFDAARRSLADLRLPLTIIGVCADGVGTTARMGSAVVDGLRGFEHR